MGSNNSYSSPWKTSPHPTGPTGILCTHPPYKNSSKAVTSLLSLLRVSQIWKCRPPTSLPPERRLSGSCSNYFLTLLFRCGSVHTTLTPNRQPPHPPLQKHQISQGLRHLVLHRYFKSILQQLKRTVFLSCPHTQHIFCGSWVKPDPCFHH